MSCTNSRVRALALRMLSTRCGKPGRKRSWPMRKNGPPARANAVGLDHNGAGRAARNRSYQSMTSSVASASSDARHGTMAGTRVRCASFTGPIPTGENSSDRPPPPPTATAGGRGKRMRCGGRHTA